MGSESLQKFSRELKTLREDKGISLSQISSRTKIDLKFLIAIEDTNFDVLPEIYIRAFIKEYAQTIDANPKLILEKFDLAKSGKEEVVVKEIKQQEVLVKEDTPVVAKPIAIIQQKEPKVETDTSLPHSAQKNPAKNSLQNIKLNYILGGLVLFVAVVIAYFAFFREQSNIIVTNDRLSNFPQSNKPRYEVAQPLKTADTIATEKQSNLVVESPKVNPSPVVVQPIAKSDSLQLSIQTSERVWVKVYKDGKVVFQQMVEKGTNLKYHAKNKFAVSVGNVGAVKIFYNNKQITNIGKAGESKNISIAPDGIRYYTISSNEKKSTPTN